MRSRTTITALIAALSLLAAVVTHGGGEAGAIILPCSAEVSPAENLQATVRGALPGAVICLKPGWHSSRGLVLDAYTRPNITIRGAGTDQTVLVSDGSIDAVLIVDTRGVTVENLIVAGGRPAGIYVSNSQEVTLRNVVAVYNGIGVHIDRNTSAQVLDSVIAGNREDGLLVRNGATVTLTNNVSAINGGVGISAVGQTGKLVATGNTIAGNKGPGFFAGQAPCALLPPGVLEAPSCYLRDLPAYIGSSDVTLENNVISGNGSTGLVFFPGTTALLRKNEISDNLLTGLFVWGAKVNVYGNVFISNEEHAIEYRAYPDPLHFRKLTGGFPLRAVGIINGNEITETFRLGRILGGGILSQGADLKVRDNEVRKNAGIGISFVNWSKGEIRSNKIIQNGGSALCLSANSTPSVYSNTMFGNLSNKKGVCAESPP